jgi:hypothetical protein
MPIQIQTFSSIRTRIRVTVRDPNKQNKKIYQNIPSGLIFFMLPELIIQNILFLNATVSKSIIFFSFCCACIDSKRHTAS